MNKGKIIVIEGTDGSGKETQSKKLYEYFKSIGKKVAYFSFPMYETATGKIVGGPYLGKGEICESYFLEGSSKVDPLVSSLYYAADRRYNFLNTINDEIKKNDIIILDRYTTSNMGHQAGKAKDEEEFFKIINFIETVEYDLCELPIPDEVIFLHMPSRASVDLRKGRKFTDGNESDFNHILKAEEAYVKLAKLKNWEYINCLKNSIYNDINDIKSIDEIHEEIKKLVLKK